MIRERNLGKKDEDIEEKFIDEEECDDEDEEEG